MVPNRATHHFCKAYFTYLKHIYVCMYVCKIHLTSVKNVMITKSSIYNTDLSRAHCGGVLEPSVTSAMVFLVKTVNGWEP